MLLSTKPSLQPQSALFQDTEIQSLRNVVCFLRMALVQEGVSLSLHQQLGPSHFHTLGALSLPMFPPEALGSPLLMPQFGVTTHSMLCVFYTRSAGPGDCVRSEDKPRTWQNDAQGVRVQHVVVVRWHRHSERSFLHTK